MFPICSSDSTDDPLETMMRAWLASYDFNLPLIDAINDPALHAKRSEIAALSLPEGLDSGYYSAMELADAIALMWSEARDDVPIEGSEARVHLADVLDRDEGGYLTCLYRALGSLKLEEAAGHMGWLTGVMRDRADMYRVVCAAGITASALPGR